MAQDQGKSDLIQQALHDIVNGEMTATALENQLSTLEHKINELIVALESPGQHQTPEDTGCKAEKSDTASAEQD